WPSDRRARRFSWRFDLAARPDDSPRGQSDPSFRAAPHFVMDGAGPLRFLLEALERRDPVVPLDEGRHLSEAPHRVAVEIPDGIHDRVVVRVEKIVALVGVPGEMELPDRLRRDAVQIVARIEAVVAGA